MTKSNQSNTIGSLLIGAVIETIVALFIPVRDLSNSLAIQFYAKL